MRNNDKWEQLMQMKHQLHVIQWLHGIKIESNWKLTHRSGSYKVNKEQSSGCFGKENNMSIDISIVFAITTGAFISAKPSPFLNLNSQTKQQPLKALLALSKSSFSHNQALSPISAHDPFILITCTRTRVGRDENKFRKTTWRIIVEWHRVGNQSTAKRDCSESNIYRSGGGKIWKFFNTPTQSSALSAFIGNTVVPKTISH